MMNFRPLTNPAPAVGIATISCAAALLANSSAEEFADPFPPEVQTLASDADPLPALAFDGLTSHQSPLPLAPGAVVSDWPHLLGPGYRLTTPESPLRTTFPENGPPLVWEVARGAGFAPPVIRGDHLVFVHRSGPRSEAVECLHPETGQRYWQHEYDAEQITNFGIDDSARASPTIDGDFVYTLGVTSHFHCFHIPTGRIVWSRDLGSEFAIPHNFFGKGASPLIYKDLVVLNVGGRDNLCVAAFDKQSGQIRWVSRHPWGASYASPLPGKIHGKDRLFVFAGGESQPPHGGLLLIDPANGDILSETPWRAEMYASVNAASPVLVGENQVFITEAYTHGGALLRFDPNDQAAFVWKAPRFGCQFSTPILFNDYLYGFDGSSDPGATLVCFDAATGAEKWRNQQLSLGRANLLAANIPGVFFCLGEHGELLTLKPSPDKIEILAQTQLFSAPDTFSPPVLSRGLLYIIQSRPDVKNGAGPRLLCYDLRAPAP